MADKSPLTNSTMVTTQFIRTTSWGTDKLHTRNPWVRVCDGKVRILLRRDSWASNGYI